MMYRQTGKNSYKRIGKIEETVIKAGIYAKQNKSFQELLAIALGAYSMIFLIFILLKIFG